MIFEDWPERLDAELLAAQGREFEWGTHDCCLFAADVVLAITGVDYAKDYRGKYTDMKGAYKLLRKEPLAVLLDSKFSRVAHPSRGDVVLIDGKLLDQRRKALGVCIGIRVAVVREDGGLFYLPTASEGIVGWSVRNG